jgi:membrane fusion protein (multidrug efflux system)
VAAVLVDDNARSAGDVLVRIDPRDYQARVDQERAALEIAESQAPCGSAGNGSSDQRHYRDRYRPAEAQVAPLAGSSASQWTPVKPAAPIWLMPRRMSKARGNFDRAAGDLARMKPLIAKEEISQQQFDAYTAAARVADGQLRAAQQKLASARDESQSNEAAVGAAQARLAKARADLAQSRTNRKQVDISAAQASSANASVQQARANLAAAELLLSYATIQAPVDGVVTKKSVQLGQIVQPGQALTILVPLRDVWVTANFKETQLKNVHVGQRAEVKVDMYGKTFPGRVDSLAGATGTRISLLPPENATGNYVKVVQRIPVKITLDSLPAEYVLRPGMNVEATIFTK